MGKANVLSTNPGSLDDILAITLYLVIICRNRKDIMIYKFKAQNWKLIP